MATWKAKITEVSALDSGGHQEAKFNLIKPNGQLAQIGGQLVVLSATGNPTNIQARIVTVATAFIQEFNAAGNLTVNQEIPFEV